MTILGRNPQFETTSVGECKKCGKELHDSDHYTRIYSTNNECVCEDCIIDYYAVCKRCGSLYDYEETGGDYCEDCEIEIAEEEEEKNG